MNYVIVIPSLEPDDKLIPYVRSLTDAGIDKIIVVNDGSSENCSGIFDTINEMDNCYVLTHRVNRGKGAAIKTALRYYNNEIFEYKGIITVDADGQHSVSDVLRMCEAMDENPDSFVLGCRDFTEGTPSKSLIGNRITSIAMRLFYGIRLNDTQTGLRGIPNCMIDGLLTLRGTRYEYELNMLIYAKGHCIPFVTIPIETIYFDNNSGSHYRPVADSARIFVRVLSGLVWFSASAICSSVVDIAIFGIMTNIILASLPLFSKILISFIVARAASSSLNFALNRHLPSSQNKSISDTIPKYYALVIVQMAVSFLCIWRLCEIISLDETIIKIIVDCILGLISYQIQLRWVFCGTTDTPILNEKR